MPLNTGKKRTEIALDDVANSTNVPQEAATNQPQQAEAFVPLSSAAQPLSH